MGQIRKFCGFVVPVLSVDTVPVHVVFIIVKVILFSVRNLRLCTGRYRIPARTRFYAPVQPGTGLPGVLCDGYWVIPGGKAARMWC
jgi:hypothetical protein